MSALGKYLNTIRNGYLTIIKQDNHIVQFNMSEKYLLGDYLC
ncbi:DUF2292 domain-containing protein [Gottschalkia acidurici]|nr:DUF2292 domain-containing protein [Gottschalkia acidurici]